MFPQSVNLLEAQEEKEEKVEEEQGRGGGGAIMLDNANLNNYDEDGGSDMLVGLDET